MTVHYTPNSTSEWTVWHDIPHRVGMVRKFGVRWLAISPAGRTIGNFGSMSEAANYLVTEDEKNDEASTT